MMKKIIRFLTKGDFLTGKSFVPMFGVVDNALALMLLIREACGRKKSLFNSYIYCLFQSRIVQV